MKLEGINVLAILSDDFEDLEFWVPVMRLREEGANVVVAGIEKNKKYIGKYGVPAESTHSFLELSHEDFHGILIPGGWSPDKLRRYPELLKIIKDMDREKKVIGQICHAAWVTISAKVVEGKNVTSTPGIRDDLENAGAIWHDEAVVVDDNFVSSRRPPDIPDYNRELVKAFLKLK
ncbi:type 1 glutamine amidotransferase domain-containing protein [uncultured Ilyobacter sp.]|uniref:type 1 glutamine amidotransferase domain-containing protein n=1 Tax=uncultured Ilyobacter sp. TaxID=544433 RepID=UPI002AA6C1EC|nr:type 1 glutamine amidotransferase domain-containing protein [uncultured Ilyobacter sp.]